MKYFKLFNESVLGNLMDDSESSVYRYLGKPNLPIWSNNLRDILETKSIIRIKYEDMKTNDHIIKIDKMLKPFYGGRKYRNNNPVMYPDIKDVVNSRFGYCWYLDKLEQDEQGYGGNKWDICIQIFEDEWYLVNIGSGQGYFNYWYLCDQFEGLEQLVKDKLS